MLAGAEVTGRSKNAWTRLLQPSRVGRGASKNRGSGVFGRSQIHGRTPPIRTLRRRRPTLSDRIISCCRLTRTWPLRRGAGSNSHRVRWSVCATDHESRLSELTRSVVRRAVRHVGGRTRCAHGPYERVNIRVATFMCRPLWRLEMMERSVEVSPCPRARITGVVYLIFLTAVCGEFLLKGLVVQATPRLQRITFWRTSLCFGWV